MLKIQRAANGGVALPLNGRLDADRVNERSALLAAERGVPRREALHPRTHVVHVDAPHARCAAPYAHAGSTMSGDHARHRLVGSWIARCS